MFLLQLSLNNLKYTAILKNLHNAISLDYHYKRGLVFWSDVSMDYIRVARLNGTETGGHLYNYIYVFVLNSIKKTIVTNYEKKSRSEGLMFTRWRKYNSNTMVGKWVNAALSKLNKE